MVKVVKAEAVAVKEVAARAVKEDHKMVYTMYLKYRFYYCQLRFQSQ